MTSAPQAGSEVTLATPLRTVLGASAARKLADKLSLLTVGELLRHYPRKYERRGRESDLASLKVGDRVTVQATVRSVVDRRLGRDRKVRNVTNVVVGDQRLELTCTFFNRYNLVQRLPVGTVAMFSGTVSTFRGALQITSPEVAVISGTDSVRRSRSAGPDQPPDAAGRSDPAGLDSAAGNAPAGSNAGKTAATKDELDVLEAFPGGIIPVYPLADGVNGALLQRCVRTVLDVLDVVADPLAAQWLAARGLVELGVALRDVHRPADQHSLDAAIDRLRYDEALSIQLVLARRRAQAREYPAQPCPPVVGGLLDRFDADLPFVLTAGQRAVGREIADDLSTVHPMNRLLQGEVCSGKTIVALRAMLQVLDNGRQAVLLAPTEVLAAQHARSLRAVLGTLGGGGELGSRADAVQVTLLTGSMSTPARRVALLDIASGQAGIAVGTHALLSDTVQFADLGLVVIDEQHRFGVEQRDALRSKVPAGEPPHVLVMTATPIPRTVAMTVYGDLDTSTLAELPVGRSPISTTVVPAAERPAWLERAWSRVREEVAAGHQAYIVCPKIGDERAAGEQQADTQDEEEWDAGKPDGDGRRPPLAVLDVARSLAEGPLAGLRLGTLHGRLPAGEKDAAMTAFAAGRIEVLVATTVIEVGVDVANATMMVVLDAERFGMSQLHQLRGRVGRGSAPGICLLVTEAPARSLGRDRLDAVAGTTDGFALAEADLGLRREGDVLGTSQAGRSTSLRQLSLLRDREVIERARADAIELVGADPMMTNYPELAGMVASVIAEQGQEFLEKG